MRSDSGRFSFFSWIIQRSRLVGCSSRGGRDRRLRALSESDFARDSCQPNRGGGTRPSSRSFQSIAGSSMKNHERRGEEQRHHNRDHDSGRFQPRQELPQLPVSRRRPTSATNRRRRRPFRGRQRASSEEPSRTPFSLYQGEKDNGTSHVDGDDPSSEKERAHGIDRRKAPEKKSDRDPRRDPDTVSGWAANPDVAE